MTKRRKRIDPLVFYEIVFSNNNRKHALQTWINRGQRNFTGLHFKLGLNFELHLMVMEWSRNNIENSPVGEGWGKYQYATRTPCNFLA